MLTPWELHSSYGFNLIPMRQDYKRPCVSFLHFHADGGRRVQDGEIRAWIAKHENFAVLTGKWSRVVVVDCDSEEAYEFALSFCPPTPMEVYTSVKNQETGWRGRHLYYRHPGEGSWIHQKLGIYRNPEKPDVKDKIKLDIKGDGHYVLAPGAKHKSGSYYEPTAEWDPSIVDTLPIWDWNWFPAHARPGWSPPPPPGAAERHDSGEFCDWTPFARGLHFVTQVRDGAIAGQYGNKRTFQTARKLFEFGCSEAEVYELMVEYNYKCVPPWSENEIRGFVRQGKKYQGAPDAPPVFRKLKHEKLSTQRPDDQAFLKSLDATAPQEPETPQEPSEAPDDELEGKAPSKRSKAPRNDGEATAKVVDLDAERKKRDKRPVIHINGHLDREIKQTISTLHSLNNPPFLFLRNDQIVEILPHPDPERPPTIEVVNNIHFRTILSQKINYTEYSKKEKADIPQAASVELANALHNMPRRLGLPVLEKVVTLPELAADGSLCTVPGYDEVTRTYYSPLPGYEMQPIPDIVSDEDISEAKALFTEEVLADFLFVNDGRNWWGETCSASYCHGFCLFLEPCARVFMGQGAKMPITIIQASDVGAGKTAFAENAMLAATGFYPAQFSPPAGNNNREWVNVLLTVLDESMGGILIDNMKGNELKHREADKVMTQSTYSGRMMNKQKNMTVSNDKKWCGTSNQAELTRDFTRRSVFSTLAAHPEDKDSRDFVIGDIEEWMPQNYVRVARAIRVLLKGWIQDGKPMWRDLRPENCLGLDGARAHVRSFSRWGRVMGGIMDWLGVHGFYTNHKEAARKADFEGQEADEFWLALWERFQEQPFKVSDAIPVVQGSYAEEPYLLMSVPGIHDQASGHIGELGKWFRKHDGQTRHGIKLTSGHGRRRRHYKLSHESNGSKVGSRADHSKRIVSHDPSGVVQGRPGSNPGPRTGHEQLEMELPEVIRPGCPPKTKTFASHAHVHARMSCAREGEKFENTPDTLDGSNGPLQEPSNDNVSSSGSSCRGGPGRPRQTPETPDGSCDTIRFENNEEPREEIRSWERDGKEPILEALQRTDEQLRALNDRAEWFALWEGYFGEACYPIDRPTRRDSGYLVRTNVGDKMIPRRHDFIQAFWDKVKGESSD